MISKPDTCTILKLYKRDEDIPVPRLKHSPSGNGISHLVIDGVYRSLSSSGEVVDYKQMSPAELTAMLNYVVKIAHEKPDEEALKRFDGVDAPPIFTTPESN